MHTTKEKVGDLCSYYRTRLAGQPPFTVLSFDGRTFMCNFGCSLVTEDRAHIVNHLLSEHKSELTNWQMNERLMRYSLKYIQSQPVVRR